jgi:LysM repeat protein
MNFRNSLPVFILIALILVGAGAAQAQSPRVPQQEPGPDGGLVHVVNFGDTLASIMAAYAEYGITMEQLQERNGWRFPPQFIYVDDRIVILPSGSVEPGNGLPVPADAAPAAPPPTSEAADVSAPANSAAPTPEFERLTMEQIAAITPVEAIAPFLP